MSKALFDAVREFPIPTLMELLGHKAERTGNELYYISPLPDRIGEKTPSFTVNLVKNSWFDQGSGVRKGGNVIDLVLEMNPDYSKIMAARYIETISKSPAVQEAVIRTKEWTKRSNNKSRKERTIIEVKALTEPALYNYIAVIRQINLKLILKEEVNRNAFKEVRYLTEGYDTQFYSFGMKNESGGWNLRSNGYQGIIGKNDYSFLKGNGIEVAIFESSIDYLSLLTIYQTARFKCDVIILNSLNNLERTYYLMANYRNAWTYFDNDPSSQAGQKASAKFAADMATANPTMVVRNKSDFFAGYKDLNDLLLKKPLPALGAAPVPLKDTARWYLWVSFRKDLEIKGKDNRRIKTMPYYSFNNHQSGYDQLCKRLLNLIQRKVVEHSQIYERNTNGGWDLVPGTSQHYNY